MTLSQVEKEYGPVEIVNKLHNEDINKARAAFN